MGIKNKLLVRFHIEEDCSQDEGEVSIEWRPINFSIYSPIFIELIDIATGQWLSENKLDSALFYEVIFSHTISRDGGGAVTDEWFEPILVEWQSK